MSPEAGATSLAVFPRVRLEVSATQLVPLLVTTKTPFQGDCQESVPIAASWTMCVSVRPELLAVPVAPPFVVV